MTTFLSYCYERFCNHFTEAENTPKHLSKLKNVEYKISAKNDPHRLKDGTCLYSGGCNQYFVLIQLSTILLDCFKIERKLLLIPNVIPQFHIVNYLNNQYVKYLYFISYV